MNLLFLIDARYVIYNIFFTILIAFDIQLENYIWFKSSLAYKLEWQGSEKKAIVSENIFCVRAIAIMFNCARVQEICEW